MLGMVYETSKLHPMNGINYRGHDLKAVVQKAQRALPDGKQPIPEAIFYLLLTGEFPT